MTLSVGDAFAGFHIVAVLEVSRRDAVYLAAGPTQPSEEILRVYSPTVEVDVYTDDEAYSRFRREMIAASDVRIDNLATIHRIGRTDGRTWVTSAAAQGVPMSSYIARAGPPPIADTIRIAQIVATVLDDLHKCSIIHRDLGTHCIYVDQAKNPPLITVAGLDSPRRMPISESDITSPEPPLFVHHPTPEDLLGNPVIEASDQFSLACTVFELLTGVTPFAKEPLSASIRATVHEQPQELRRLRPELPDEFERILRRAMSKSPQRRYLSCSHFVSALTAAAIPRPRPLPNPPRAYRLCVPRTPPHRQPSPRAITWFIRPGDEVQLGSPLFALTNGSETNGSPSFSPRSCTHRWTARFWIFGSIPIPSSNPETRSQSSASR